MSDTADTIFGRRPGTWAGALILGLALARLAFLMSGSVELVQDEAQYWDWSRTLQWSYFTKPPLIAWLIRLSTEIFGVSDLAVRLPAVALAAATQAALYLGLARLCGRPRLGLLAVLVADTSVLGMVSGLLMTTDNPLILCWTLALFALHGLAVRPEKQWPAGLLAVSLALGCLAKYMMLAFIPVAGLYLWGLARFGLLPVGAARRAARALGLGLALGMAPVLAWNLQNDWVGLRHVGHLAGVQGREAATLLRLDRFPEYLAGQVGLLTPWWFVFMLLGGVRALAAAWRGRPAPGGLDRASAWLLCCGFWPLWGGLLVWSFHAKMNANWPAVSYAAGLALAGAAFGDLAARLGARSVRVWAWPVLGGLLFLAAHLHDALPLPDRLELPRPGAGAPLVLENPAGRLKGWSDLGAALERLRMNHFPDPDKVFVFADNYDLTAALAFHVPGRPRTYCVNLGRRYNQYDLWPGPEDKIGWDALYVRQKFKEAIEPQVAALFEKTVSMHYQTAHRGKPARQFTIYLCYGFRGVWPRGTGTGY